VHEEVVARSPSPLARIASAPAVSAGAADAGEPGEGSACDELSRVGVRVSGDWPRIAHSPSVALSVLSAGVAGALRAAEAPERQPAVHWRECPRLLSAKPLQQKELTECRPNR
jgi:hypothetical protein